MVTLFQKVKREVAYGVSIFLSVYIISLLYWPLSVIHPAMFTAIYSLTLTFFLLYHSMRYFIPHRKHYHERAMRVSFVWFIIFTLLGVVSYTSVPFYMSLFEYFVEIGLLSLLVVLIPNGVGCMGKQVYNKMSPKGLV